MIIRVLLFIATIFSTYFVQGIWYCISIMSILLAHELGHYFACRYYGVSATLPVFIPMPLSLFGTMGAVIKIRSPIPHKRALFDIGAAGPLAGLAVALPFTIIGLKLSRVVQVQEAENLLRLGEPLLLKFLSGIVIGDIPAGYDTILHPLAYAGWVGMFVTALNLMPVGQLDGGHIAYAVFGTKSKYLYAGVVGMFLSLCLTRVLHWLYLIFLTIIVLIAFRHGPTIWEFVRLDTKRKLLAVVMLIIFLLCFIPIPIEFPYPYHP